MPSMPRQSNAAASRAVAIDAKQALQTALGHLTVSELVTCKETLRKFHSFLATGTPREWKRLIPQEGRPSCARRRPPTAALTPAPTTPKPAPPSSSVTPTPSASATTDRTPRPTSESPYTSRLGSQSIPSSPQATALSNPEHLRWLESSSSRSPSATSTPSYTLSTADVAASGPASPSPSDYDHDHNELASLSHISVLAQRYFQSRLGRARQDRAPYLLRAVQGFLGELEISPGFARDVWSSRPDIFGKACGTGLVARLQRLYSGHCKLRSSRDDYSCADRLCYIFLDHDLQQLAQSDELVMSQGRGRKTAALCKQAQQISTTVRELRASRKAGSGYRHLLDYAGPGFLLQMGSNVATIWERKLSKADVYLVVDFLKEITPDVYERGTALNGVASQALVNGFLAYGWTLSELASTQSSLIDQCKLHIDMNDESGVDRSRMEKILDSQLHSNCTLQGSYSQTSTNHGSSNEHEETPAASPAATLRNSISATKSPSIYTFSDVFDTPLYEDINSQSNSPGQVFSELSYELIDERLARQVSEARRSSMASVDTTSSTLGDFDGLITPSPMSIPMRMTQEATILPATPMDSIGTDFFGCESLTPFIRSDTDLSILLRSLENDFSYNIQSKHSALVGSDSAQSNTMTSTDLSPIYDRAITIDTYEHNWKSDLGDVDMGGVDCLITSGEDPICGLHTYTNPAGTDMQSRHARQSNKSWL